MKEFSRHTERHRPCGRGYAAMPSQCGGFSLIEAVVAIAIVGVMIVTVGVLLERLPVHGREVRDQDLALKIVQGELEILRAGGYGALPGSGPFSHTLLSSLVSGTASLTITDYNDTTKQVVARVEWQGTGSTPRAVSLTTLITENSGLP